MQIARRFVDSLLVRRDGESRCPICGQRGAYFYSKWRVDYLCCTECKSVYVVCDEDIVESYRRDDELLELRRSREY